MESILRAEAGSDDGHIEGTAFPRRRLPRTLVALLASASTLVVCLFVLTFGPSSTLVPPPVNDAFTGRPGRPPSAPLGVPDWKHNMPAHSPVGDQYFFSLEDSTWATRDSPSFLWAPMAVRNCTHLTPAWYAPCVALRSPFAAHLYAEELIYPDFGLPFPVFVKEEHAARWRAGLKSVEDRAIPKELYGADYMVYKSQHGQNYVFHNVSYDPAGRFDSWSADSCMSPHTSLGSIIVANDTERTTNKPPISAIMVNTPDSWSFQHFLDRATHIVAQAAHLSVTTPVALTGRQGAPLVQQLWARMGFGDGKTMHSHSGKLNLERLVFSCKTVLIHPFLSWKALEMLRMPWALHYGWEAAPTGKKVVMYMSRSDGRAGNGGRKVQNENEVLAAIGELLDERGQGERLELFDPTKYDDVDALISAFSNDVSAIVGPHGGALMNHRFAGPNTLVLEFLPTSRIEYINYEETSMLNQTYAVVVVEPAPGTTDDMVIDPADVRTILHAHLGRPSPKSMILPYMWDKE